jgi:hypothetical protein
MKFGRLLFGILALIVIVIGMWIGWHMYVLHSFPDSMAINDDQAKILAARGQLGDMFGGVNALFTALLLAVALYTIWLQQRQIAAMHAQQIAQERDNKELATLQAMTALVNARSALIHTRFDLHRDASNVLREKTVDSSWEPFLKALFFKNAESAGRDMNSLVELADQLDQMIREGEDNSESMA